ncbi:MAG: ImmA/IrrE family metallo-endopeptidase [Oligoflexales bacterium]|nr:ImmA/IrrE family metallo-endopeptidase [Oligoflexales bacterium]
MKKTAENRYPHSATLFKFCKEALEIRYEGNVKVIDQDVGSILGYDPADCSHWKKGKKNIHALATLRSIADHLNLDERLLIEIAAGKIGLEEAIFEYRGYGSFALDGQHLENLKKDFFKNPGKWKKDSLKSFEELFDIDRNKVVEASEQVLQSGHFEEAPIYIPEVYQLYPNLVLEKNESLDISYKCIREGEGKTAKLLIQYKGPEMRPYIRFLVAKEFFKFLSANKIDFGEQFWGAPQEVQEIQANIFAGNLLIPGSLLRKEVERVDSSIDLVMQLAETFWVSKASMNQRLRDYLEFLN